MTKRLLSLAASAALALAASAFIAPMVKAATTMCPGTVDTNDREFSLTVTGPAPDCIGFGSGNISGNPSGPNPDPNFSLAAFPAGAGLLDKTDDGADTVPARPENTTATRSGVASA